MIKGNKRALAYIDSIIDVQPIEGADNIELVTIRGWHCIAKKGEFQKGDLCVYFEIDSLLPNDKVWSAFMEPKKFKVKTMKLNKFNCVSQGLALPFSSFEEDGIVLPTEIGSDVTDLLGVIYYEPEDNLRKATSADKYSRICQRHPKFFKNKIVRAIWKTKFGKKLLYSLFKSEVKKTNWPEWVSKTDEERVQNMPFILKNECKWVATEKIDGTSTTFTMRKRGKNKYDFYVCSRNVVFDKPNAKCYYEKNFYVEMALKYNIEDRLHEMLFDDDRFKDCEWITLQGETYGTGVQKRDYSANERKLAGFNLITSKDGRLDSVKASIVAGEYGIPWVPIIDRDFNMPKTVDEVVAAASGKSVIDGGMREGLVFRSHDGKKSFKAVSVDYLLKYHS